MNITELIRNTEELKELSEFPFLYVYRTIEILIEKGYIKNVDRI